MTARIDRIWPDPAEQLHDDELMDAVDHEAVRLNFVSSIDGAATRDGRSGGLGGPADKRYFDLLRRVADVVVVGAGTVRAPIACSFERACYRPRCWSEGRGLSECESNPPCDRGSPIRPISNLNRALDRQRRRRVRFDTHVVHNVGSSWVPNAVVRRPQNLVLLTSIGLRNSRAGAAVGENDRCELSPHAIRRSRCRPTADKLQRKSLRSGRTAHLCWKHAPEQRQNLARKIA